MPHATADDGVRLYYEETGSGIPVIFVHEYAGDHRSWEAADAAFRPALSGDHLCRARLSAVRRAGGRGEVFADPRGRRHRRGARPSADRQGACGRAVDGRLRDAAFRVSPCGAGAVAGGGGVRLWRRAGPARPVPRRGRGDRRLSSTRRAFRRSPRNTPTARPACSSRTRTRAGSPSSRRSWQSTRRWARATRSWACSGSGRRCTSWWIR